MQGYKSLTVDFTKEASVLQIYPHSPLLSSQGVAWHGIHVAHYYQPAHATPQYCPTQYIVGIYLGHSVTLEQWWSNECYVREHQIYGDISIYPAKNSLKECWNYPAEFLEVYLEPAIFACVSHELFERDVVEVLPHPTVRDPLIQQMGLVLKTELETMIESNKIDTVASSSCLYAESIAHMLVLHILKHYSVLKWKTSPHSGGLSPSKLRAVTTYIHENLDRNLSLSDIAAEVHTGSHYLASLFKQSTGQTLHQYVTSCRIEKAKELLAKQKLTIAEIGQQVGFQSQSHFTKVFRKHTQLTPKTYRNMM